MVPGWTQTCMFPAQVGGNTNRALTMENLQKQLALSAQAHTPPISIYPRITTVSWHSIQFASYCLMKTRHDEHHSFHLPAVPGNVLVTATVISLGWQVGRASLLVLCSCTGQAGTTVWTWAEGTRYLSKCLWLWLWLCHSRYTSGGIMAHEGHTGVGAPQRTVPEWIYAAAGIALSRLWLIDMAPLEAGAALRHFRLWVNPSCSKGSGSNVKPWHAGLDHLKSLFQPKWFHCSQPETWHCFPTNINREY